MRPSLESSSRAPSTSEPAREPNQSRAASWLKAMILAAAVVVIGAFAWYVVDRVGERLWVVKLSVVAWLIGMGTASAMISAGRTCAGSKILSALAAILAIVLGKALIVCLPQLPAELASIADPQQWARAFARLAFKPVDPLFLAMAITGSAVRFILSKRD
ncbi:MAG: hypothetical protein ABIP55_07290 [Tepidisphaeraceae bacterium]